MRHWIIISVLLICQTCLKADFDPMSLHELIIKSEKIVHGEILNIDSTHFEIQVEGSLTNDTGVLKVRKFENWTCAWRWTEYEKGQKLLLFLKSWNNEFVSMGAGNEGELPIVDNNTYINGLCLMYVNGDQNNWSNTDFTFPGNRFDIQGGQFYGTEIALYKLLETAKYIRTCLDFEYGKYYQIEKWQFKCNHNEMKQNAEKSLLLNAILREAKERKNER